MVGDGMRWSCCAALEHVWEMNWLLGYLWAAFFAMLNLPVVRSRIGYQPVQIYQISTWPGAAIAAAGYSWTAPSAVLLILGSPANPSKLICWLVLTTGTNTYNPALCKALDAIYRHLTVKISTTPIRIQCLPDTCSHVKEQETRVVTCILDHSQ